MADYSLFISSKLTDKEKNHAIALKYKVLLFNFVVQSTFSGSVEYH